MMALLNFIDMRKMKNYRNLMLVVVAMATLSCAKELVPNEPKENANLSPLSIVASSEKGDVRAAFSEDDYPAIVWQGNESITVLGENTGNQTFSTTSTGANAVFSGLADLTDDVLYSVYPADGNIKLNKTTDGTVKLANVTIPAVQTAVAGSFDPKAYTAVAKSSDDKANFSFKSLVSFLKFSLEDAENVDAVVIAGNNNENMACTASAVKLEGSHAGDYTNVSRYVRLQGTFETGKAYFMTVRPLAFNEGVTIYVQYNDGSVKSCKAKGPLFTVGKVRNHIKPLGTIPSSKLQPVTDLYTLYNLGFDIDVAGMVVNKTTFPNAKLVTATEAYTPIADLDEDCITFLAQKDGASFKMTANCAFDSKVMICSQFADNKVTIKTDSKYFQANGGSLYLKNIEVDATGTSAYLIRNYGAKADTDAIVIDGCNISHLSQDLMKLVQKGLTVDVIKIYGSNIGFLSSDETYMIENNQAVVYDKIDLYNNVFYCEDGGNKVGTIFSNTDSSQKASINSIRIENNTIVGLYPNNKTHYVMVNAVQNVIQKNNYFHLPDYYNYVKPDDAPSSYTLSIIKAKTNADVGKIDVNNAYLYYDSSIGKPTTLKAFAIDYSGLSLNATMSTESKLDLATFVCSYAGYGAQR